VTQRNKITVAAQLDLSRDEDSIQSLASLTTPTGLLTLAGINSSAASQKSGANEHLRSFEVTFPKRKRSNEDQEKETEGQIAFTSKTALFQARADGKARPYQRLLKLSPVVSREAPKKRLCVAATGDAAKNEIVVFDATTATPDESSICARLSPPEGVEAVDLDLTEESAEGSENGKFAVAYCTDYEVYVCRLKYDFQSKQTSPRRPETNVVYKATNGSNAKAGTVEPKIRCLRWLSPHHLLILQKSGSSPAELVLLNLASSSNSSPEGEVNLRKSLPKSLEVAAHLDICALNPDPASGERQYLVAVAGADKSRESAIHIYTLDHCPSDPDPWRQVWQVNTFTTLNRTHSSNIMKITFSNFFPPRQNPESTMSVATPNQHIHLASVSWGGTVSVETFTLTSTPTKPHDTTAARTSDANPRGTPSVRWVLTTNSMIERLTSRAGIIVIALTVLLASILLQSYITMTNGDAAAVSPFRRAVNMMQPPGARAPSLGNSIRQDGKTVSSFVVGATSSATKNFRSDASIVSSVVISAASSASSVAVDAVDSAGKLAAEATAKAGEAAEVVVEKAKEFNPVPGMQHKLSDLLTWREKSSHSSFSEGPNAVQEQHLIHVRASADDSHLDAIEGGDKSESNDGTPAQAAAGLTASLIPAEQRAELAELQAQGAKKWEELSANEKTKWRRRMKEAGEFGENVPETILKGVLWSEFANVVGGGLRDAVLG
jgi:hypothetical protein